MNYFILDRNLQTVAIAQTDSTSRNAFLVLDDKYDETSNAPATLELTFDFYNPNIKHVVEGAYVVFKYIDKFKMLQIKQVDEYHASDSYVIAFAEESSFELLDAVVFPKSYQNQSARYLLEIALADTDFEIGDCVDVNIPTFDFDSYGTALSQVQKIANDNNLKLDFRVEFTPQKGVTGKFVDLVEKIEIDEGKRLEFGRNVDNIKRTIDRTQICTAVIPIGENDTLVNGFDWKNIYEDKDIEKQKDLYYVELNDKARNEINPNSDRHLFYALQVASSDKATLCQKAYEHLKDYRNPKYTYEANAIALKNEVYQIGEQVRIIDDELGVSMVAEVETVTISFCNPDANAITLTNFIEKKSNISNVLYNIQNKLQTSILNNPLIVIGDTKPEHTETNGKGTVWIDTSDKQSGIVKLEQFDPTKGDWVTIQNMPSNEKVESDIKAESDAIKSEVETQLLTKEPIVLKSDSFPLTAIEGQLFILQTTNEIYRWNGTEWILVGTSKEEVEGIKQDVADAEKAIDDANKEIEDAKQEIEKAKQDLAQHETDISGINKSIEDANAEIESAKQEIEQVKKDATDSQNEINGELGTIKNDIEQSEKDIEQINKDIEQAEKDIEATSQELAGTKQDLQTATTNLQSQADALKQRATNLEGSVSTINTNIDTINGELTTKATKTEVQTLVNGIEIGVTNLVLDSERERTLNNFYELYTYEILKEHVGKQIVLSFYARSTVNATRTMNVYGYQNNGISVPILPNITITPEWQRFHYVTTVKDWGIQNVTYTKGGIAFYTGSTSDTSPFALKQIQIELGNKLTEWKPNPQDIKSEVATVTNRVTQNEANITANAEQLQSVYSELKTEQTSQSNRISKAESDITQNANMIASKVGMTEVTNAIDNIKIGGRNLLENSSFAENRNKWSVSINGIDSFVVEDGYNCMKISGEFGKTKNVSQRFDAKIQEDTINEQEYTMSGWVKVVDFVAGTTNNLMAFYVEGWYDTEFSTNNWFKGSTVKGKNYLKDYPQNEWVYIEWTFKIPNQWNTQRGVSCVIYLRDFTGDVFVRNVKLERGNKATDWTPAPEDTQSQIDAHGQRITQTESTIEQHAGMIASKVSQETYESDMQGFETRISDAESTVTQTANSITSVVQQKVTEEVQAQAGDIKDEILGQVNSDYTEFQTRLASAESKIEQNSDSIELKASKTELVTYATNKTNNLLINGYGEFGDNTNLNNLTYDGSILRDGIPSFKINSAKNFVSSAYIPVDTSRTYKISAWYKRDEVDVTDTHYAYIGYDMYDIDKLVIEPQMIYYRKGSLTTLAQDLKAGDTVVYLTDVSGFSTTTTEHQNTLIFWDYTNSYGHTYPAETYSRNSYLSVWTDGNSIDATNNTITLTKAWTGETHVAGTQVSQGRSGNTWHYNLFSDTCSKVPTNWYYKESKISGIDAGEDSWHKFRDGTVYVRFRGVWNSSNYTLWMNSIEFRDITDEVKANDFATSTVNTAKAELKVTTDAITSNVSKNATAISGLQTTTANMNTAIAQNATDISLRATKTEVTNAIKDIQIGGRNYFKDTFETPAKTCTFSGWQKYYPEHEVYRNLLPNLVGKTITISAYIKNISGTLPVGLMLHILSPDMPNGYYQLITDNPIEAGKGGWTFITLDLGVTSIQTITQAYPAIRHYSGDTSTESTVEFHSLKLEIGNKRSAWSPAPEDLNAYTDSSINTTKAEIKVTTDAISQNVSNVQASVNGLSNRVSKTETDISSNASEIALRATKTELVDTVNAIEVGGRNLLIFNPSNFTNYNTETYSKDVQNYKINLACTTHGNFGIRIDKSNFEANQHYALSFKVKKIATTGYNYKIGGHCPHSIQEFLVDGVHYDSWTDSATLNDTTDEHKVEIRFYTNQMEHSDPSVYIQINRGRQDAIYAGQFELYEIMLEQATKASDWSPAPEDAKANAEAFATSSVNTAKAEIKVTTDAISNTVSQVQTNVSGLTTRISNAETSISNNANEIALKATKTEVTNAIDNIKIGGTNLLKGSKRIYLNSNNSDFYPIAEEALVEDGREFARFTRTKQDSYPHTFSVYSNIPATQITKNLSGKEVTMSYWIRCSIETNGLRSWFVIYHEPTKTYLMQHSPETQLPANEWVRVTFTTTLPEYIASECKFRINPYTINIPDGEIANFYVDICEWQIEEGNKATAWKPAPEDAKAYTDSSVTSAKAEIKVTTDAITQNVSKMQTDVSGLTSRISTAETTISNNANEIALKASKTEVTNAIDAINVGGRNYLLNSGLEITNKNYCLYTYVPSEILTEGETYTVTACITPAPEVTSYAVYTSSGYRDLCRLSLNGTDKQILQGTFVAGYHAERLPSANPVYGNIQVYRFPSPNSIENEQDSTIHWIKIEKGNKSSLDWSPAPEDLQSYADTQVNTAKAEIKVTTDAISNTVYNVQQNVTGLTNRVSSAETSISNNAQEINLRATKTEVTNEIAGAVDSIQIGGRNLLLNSACPKSCNAETGITATIDTTNGWMKIVNAEGNAGNWNTLSFGSNSTTIAEQELQEGDTFTISFAIRTDDGTILPRIYLKTGLGYYQTKGTINSNWNRAYYTGTWKDANSIAIHLGWSGRYGTFYVKEFKLEKGNKPTAYSPAPEDLNAYADASVNTAKAEIKVTTDAITNTVSQVQSNVSGLTNRIASAETSISNNATAINLRATKTEVTNEIAGAIDAIEVGGRNLCVGLGGDNYDITKIYGSTDQQKCSTETINNKKWLKVVPTEGSGILRVGQINGLEPSSNYIWSFDIYTLGSDTGIQVYQWGGKEDGSTGSYGTINHTIGKTVTRIKHPFTASSKCTSEILHINSLTVGETYYFANFQLEKGNTATNWKPSPTDLQNYTDERITTAKAEIKVTTDAITQSVSNVSKSVSDLGTTVSSNTAQLGVHANQIASKVAQTEYDENIGLNKWQVHRYDMTIARVAPTFEHINGKSPNATYTINDDVTLKIGDGSTLNNFIGHFFTNVYVTANKEVSLNVGHDDGGTVYLNGKKIYSDSATYSSASQPLTLNLIAGWNTIDILIHEISGSDNFKLSSKLSTQVTKMMYNNGISNNDSSRLQHAESQIIQTADNIRLEVQEVQTNLTNALNSNVTSLNSKIDQKADSVTLTATKNELQGNIDNIKIGGANLFKESGRWTKAPTWWKSNGDGLTLDTATKYLGYNTIKTTIGAGIVGNNGTYFEIDPNKTYTYSAMVKASESWTSTSWALPLHYHAGTDGANNNKAVSKIKADQNLVANEWKLIYLTFNANGASYFRPYVYIGSSKAITLNIAYLKLEEGDRPTAWQPHEDDVKSYADSSVNNAKAEIKVTTDAITNTVSNVQTSVNGLTTRVSNAETSISNNATEINLRATKTEMTNAINASQAGGRNLILKSDSKVLEKPTATTTNLNTYFSLTPELINNPSLINGKAITFSFDYEFEGFTSVTGGSRFGLEFTYLRSSTTGTQWAGEWVDGNANPKCVDLLKQGSGKGRFVATLDKFKDFTDVTSISGIGLFIQVPNTGYLKLSNPQLEFGSTASVWKKAPEDIKQETTDAINTAKAEIKVTTDAITQNVSKVTNDVSGLTNRVSTAETNIASNTEQIGLRATKTEVDKAFASQSLNLIKNGLGEYKDNTNFTAFTYDGDVRCGASPSFYHEGYNVTLMVNEFIPIDINKSYRLEFDAKSKTGTAKHYAFWQQYDIDRKEISATYCTCISGTLTTLAQELKNGDTVVYLTDASKWSKTTSGTHQRGFIFWNYKDSTGFQYPAETYSRNAWLDYWADGNSIDTTNNTITLKKAWANGTIPAGTQVSQSNSGGFKYAFDGFSNAIIPTDWKHGQVELSGLTSKGNNEGRKFNPYTKYIKFGFLANREVQGDALWLSNVKCYIIDYEKYTNVKAETLQASIEINKNSITNKVESTTYETDQQNTSERIASLQSQLVQTATDLTATFERAGGKNLIRNSCGYEGLLGTMNASHVETLYDPDTDALGVKSSFHFKQDTANSKYWSSNDIKIKAGEPYTISAKVKVTNAGEGVLVYINKVTNGTASELAYATKVTATTDGYIDVTKTFTCPTDTIRVAIANYKGCESYITQLMLNEGSIALGWSSHPEEIHNGIINLSEQGIKVAQKDANGNIKGFTVMSHEEFAGYNDTDGDGDYEKIFYLNEDATVSKRLAVTQEIIMGDMKIITINNANNVGWGFIPTSSGDKRLTEGLEEEETETTDV